MELAKNLTKSLLFIAYFFIIIIVFVFGLSMPSTSSNEDNLNGCTAIELYSIEELSEVLGDSISPRGLFIVDCDEDIKISSTLWTKCGYTADEISSWDRLDVSSYTASESCAMYVTVYLDPTSRSGARAMFALTDYEVVDINGTEVKLCEAILQESGTAHVRSVFAHDGRVYRMSYRGSTSILLEYIELIVS